MHTIVIVPEDGNLRRPTSDMSYTLEDTNGNYIADADTLQLAIDKALQYDNVKEITLKVDPTDPRRAWDKTPNRFPAHSEPWNRPAADNEGAEDN